MFSEYATAAESANARRSRSASTACSSASAFLSCWLSSRASPCWACPTPAWSPSSVNKLQRPPQVRVGRLVVAKPAAHVAEVVVHVGERIGVPQPVRRRQGQPLHREHLMQPTAPL